MVVFNLHLRHGRRDQNPKRKEQLGWLQPSRPFYYSGASSPKAALDPPAFCGTAHLTSKMGWWIKCTVSHSGGRYYQWYCSPDSWKEIALPPAGTDPLAMNTAYYVDYLFRSFKTLKPLGKTARVPTLWPASPRRTGLPRGGYVTYRTDWMDIGFGTLLLSISYL